MRGRRPNYAWVDLSRNERIARLMQKVRKREDGCWEWTGKRFKNGYGQVSIRVAPKKTKYFLAHRLMWELSHGKPLGGFKALHKCDRPWCVNPACLFKGTTKDNVRDMLRKGRQNWAYGERSGKAKLTERAVRLMRKAHAEGSLHRELAVRFGVSQKQVTLIVNRKQWRHVP